MNKSIRVSFSDLEPLIRNAIQKGNSFSFVAFGNSMHPYIRGGKDKVTLSPVSAPFRAGDIVFYRRDCGTYVLHRIIKVNGNFLELCGDNQFVIEKNIRSDQVIAILTAVEKNGKMITPKHFRSIFWSFCLPARRLFKNGIYQCKKIVKKLLRYFSNHQ